MISGLVGAGAAVGLEELLTRQLLEAKAQEDMRQAKARESMQSERLKFDQQAHDDNMAMQSRMADERAAARRSADNRTGVADMLNQRKLMDAQDQEQNRQRVLESLMPMLPPHVRQAMQAQMAGISGVESDDLKTPEQLKAEEDASVRRAGRIAAAQRGPEKPDSQIITTTGPDGKPVIRRVSGPELDKGVPAYEKGGPAGGVKDERQKEYLANSANRIVDFAKKLKQQVGASTVGFGALSSFVPGSPALKFAEDLKALRGAIAFGELSKMRAASPTGGALGQVAVQELELLASQAGGMNQRMSESDWHALLDGIIAAGDKAATSVSTGGDANVSVPRQEDVAREVVRDANGRLVVKK